MITGATSANLTVTANGALTINPASGGSISTVSGGLGATLNLSGASVTENSVIRLPSGDLGIEATGAGGDVAIGGTLDVGGTAQTFNDLTKYTSGGQVSLTSQSGNVILNSGSTVTVAANAGGGNAGSLTVGAASGSFTFQGTIDAHGAVGTGGAFSLDAGGISAGNLTALDSALGAGGFTQSISVRDRTDASVTVDGLIRAATYSLSADAGSITVNGTIDASNVAATDPSGKAILVGGSINLTAAGSVTLADGSLLTVAAQSFDNAGKGGAITVAAGSETNGQFRTDAYVDIDSGSTIDLSVAENTGTSAAAGEFTGTLHLRAPQTADHTDLQVDPLNGTILNPSSILVEGYAIFDATADGSIDNQESNIYNNGQTFAGNTTAILNRILNPLTNANGAALQAVTDVAPGAEIISTTGDLTLASDWDLSSYRFGPDNTAGVLTLRAAGNLIFAGSLSDGFSDATNTATLLAQNTALPVNDQSWSYHLAAGADLSAADINRVAPNTALYDSSTGLSVPGTAGGSLELGNFVTQNNGNPITTDGTTASALAGYDQVIRTGTGDITIATSGDVLLQNQFATIYTAGVAVADPTLGGTFVTPTIKIKISDSSFYPAQYSEAGGNVTIAAQGNIAHVTQNNNGSVVIDSEKELPNNWLDRRGYVNPATGQFGASKFDAEASTSWWVDFSNFFEGIGALGGGNVTLNAGHDVSNVDAVAPANARVPYETTVNGVTDVLAADQTPVELGGGNVVVQAGNDINGGVYYVERGQGNLAAGDSIITNSTRSASLGTISVPASVNDALTWLPTTLFLGDGSFHVTAQSNLLLGPVANPFLLPQGVNNTYWDKTYFSTYATTDAVDVASLTGTVTLRESATLSSSDTATPLLQNWLQSIDLLTTNPASLSSYQPWLNITETSVAPFANVDALSPSTLQVTAFNGDVAVVGNLTLSPSPLGTVDLVAAGSIEALQPNGVSNVINGTTNTAWSSSTINLSDADPNAVPGVLSPYAYEEVVGTTSAASKTVGGTIKVGTVNVPVSLNLSFIDDLFAESGSSEGPYGVLQTKLRLHDSINGAPLHAGDTNPVHFYAENGSISGLTLFSGKDARVVAGQDITDVGLYIQNDAASDISLVAAGRDIVAYDANSPLRVSAQTDGNVLDFGSTALSGDIQISGPGTLEVLAGRDLNLGAGPTNADGTGVGISSIGNDRNPLLPFAGADIVAAAGAGPGFDDGQLDFTNASHTGFTDIFLNPATGGVLSPTYRSDLATLMGLPSSDTGEQIWAAFTQLPTDQQDRLALDIFYAVLRDGIISGGPLNAEGAIQLLFPGTSSTVAGWSHPGTITLTGREIKTTNGGDISLLAPGGQVDVGLNIAGAQAADQGILTEAGGNISIFTSGDVNVGTSRIFTLDGGDETIWSTFGTIDAGNSSKTVQSAPPTRVLVDPQSGAVETDLAGLATGGGIGTLETKGRNPSNVYLHAVTINTGDAGIRSSGTLFLRAEHIIAGGGGFGSPSIVGAPAGASAPNVAGLAAASNAAGATTSAADQAAKAAQHQVAQNGQDVPSIISVEVLGYGGTDDGQ